jgi:hypothetical protein
MFNNVPANFVTHIMTKKPRSRGENATFLVRTNAFARSGIDFSQADAAGKIYYYEKHVYTTFRRAFLFMQNCKKMIFKHLLTSST